MVESSEGTRIDQERVGRIAGAYFGDPRHRDLCIGAINKALRESDLLVTHSAIGTLEAPDGWGLHCEKCGTSPEGPCGWRTSCPTGLNKRLDSTSSINK